MTLPIYDLAGFLGAAIIVVAYFAMQQRWLNALDWRFPAANLARLAADPGVAVVRVEFPVGRDRGLLGADQPDGARPVARRTPPAQPHRGARRTERARAEKAG